MSNLDSIPAKRYEEIYNTSFDISKELNKEKEITLKDIANCNTGDLKFGHKALLFIKKGVWLNSKKVKEILCDNKNLDALNNVAKEFDKITYKQVTDSSSHHFQKGPGISNKFLTISEIISKPGKGELQAPVTGGSGIDQAIVGSIKSAAQRFQGIANLPSAEGVIMTPGSHLRKAFTEHLAQDNIIIRNKDHLKDEYVKYIDASSAKALDAIRKDDEEGSSPRVYDSLVSANMDSGMAEEKIGILNHEIKELRQQKGG